MVCLTCFFLYILRLCEESKNHDDHKSATMIQKNFRGYICREKIKILHRSTVIIQKYYRGYLGMYLCILLFHFQNCFPADGF